MHKEQHNARHLDERDKERDQRIRPVKQNTVEVVQRDGISQYCTDDKNPKYHKISRNTDVLFFVMMFF
jgi:hypothetical protein